MPTGGQPRERIMSEASRLLAGDRQASGEDIAIAAGVSRTTFYRAFPSRAQLLRAIEVQPEPDTRDRVLEASIQMLRTQTLRDLSMDALASQAAVSRANLYRLFPGKSALFTAILLAYSPFAPVMAVFARSGDHPPEEVIPEIVLTAYRTVAGHAGVVRTLLLEVTSMTPEFTQAFADTGLRAFGTFAQYLAGQMAAGGPGAVYPRPPFPKPPGGRVFSPPGPPARGPG